jgi:NAD(P)-dependent dehydrogenase (short-subunit alcohol dehydrogenase family)
MAITLEGKVAIITGGSRGIGEAIARAFVEAGAKVVVASRKLEGVQAVALSLGGAAHAVAAHTGKEAECVGLVEAAVKHFGKVDVLVNNAATNPHFGPLMTAEMGAWDKTFDVNLKGYFWMSREVAKHLIARAAPGAIVNIASVVSLVAAPMQGIYGMTKAAVVSLTKTLAFELAPSSIRVNAIAPGLVDTRLASAIVQNEDFMKRFTERTPLGRYAQPDEIAGGAVYLSSDAAKFLTGHTLVIDGGMTVC